MIKNTKMGKLGELIKEGEKTGMFDNPLQDLCKAGLLANPKTTIKVHKDTTSRLNELKTKTGAKSLDLLLNDLIDSYLLLYENGHINFELTKLHNALREIQQNTGEILSWLPVVDSEK